MHFIKGSYQVSLQCLTDDEEIVMEHLTEFETPEPDKSDPKIRKGFLG